MELYIVYCLVLIFTNLHGNLAAISIKYLFLYILFVVCSSMQLDSYIFDDGRVKYPLAIGRAVNI